MATRWGIVSVGKISTDFVKALSLLSTEEHCVAAVAARDLSRAKEFAETYGIKKYYGSYEELARDKDLDVIYIGAVHTMHFPLCKLFLNAGHNVLCEKPLMMNLPQCKEVVALAREKGVFFMEAFWSRFFPVYEDLRTLLAAGDLGSPQYVSASFGGPFKQMGVERLLNKDIGGGALLDVGCYPIQFAQMVFNHEKPKVVACGALSESGVDEMTCVTLQYSGGRMAVLTATIRCSVESEALVCGDKMVSGNQAAMVKVPNLWCPVKMETPSGVIEHKLPENSHTWNFTNSEGLSYEAEAVRHCLKNGLKEHPNMTMDNSLQLFEILDEIRRQIGVVYKEDLQQK